MTFEKNRIPVTAMLRTSQMPRSSRVLLAALVVGTLSACGGDSPSAPTSAPGFLGGVEGNREIGVVVNSDGKSITMFQLGSPTTTSTIALGTSSTITPTGLSLQGRKAAVPLGNAASVAIVNLETAIVQKFFTFASGNATGSAWSNDTTVFVANTNTNKIGRFYTTQTATEITAQTDVALAPTAVQYTGGKVFVVSGNFLNFPPTASGIVTAINPTTMAVLGTIETGGPNSSDAAVGPDGLLYVLNTGDYFAQGSIAIINPATLAVETIPNTGVGQGSISIDSNGLAYLSSFSGATMVWNTKTRAFVRGASDPVCARHVTTGLCRGASDAVTSATGKVYQTFFGSTFQGLAPFVFVYSASSFALVDSVSVGVAPISIAIRTF
ncbi:MAG: hypothetical protein ABJB74_07170 [Gemmatimonas sp.]